MNSLIESQLREVLAERAAGVPEAGGARLRGLEFHPHTSRLRARVGVPAFAGMAATGVIVGVMALGPGAPAAFADWSASPTTPTSGQTTAAVSACASRIPALPGSSTSDVASWPVVLSDTRGPYTLVVYGNGGSSATCFSGPSFTTFMEGSTGSPSGSASGMEGFSQTANQSGTPQSSQNSVRVTHTADLSVTIAHMTSSSNGPYTLVQGMAASGVTAVTLNLSDGSTVAATTGTGWFAAWWPGSQDVVSAQVTTASGTTTETIPAAGANGGLPGSPVVCPTTATCGSSSSNHITSGSTPSS